MPSNIDQLSKVLFQSVSFLVADCADQSLASKRWLRRIKNKKSYSLHRSVEISLDVTRMCEEVKDSESGLKYVYEVLPVFYSRLLRYYGDNDASCKFSDQVIRPNFYDQLYGGAIK